ncbi:MAG: hypothetical protein HRT44_01750 [Bdellovibrionales bacterium]|nr:hypothetical protein [Bdellovibrionales bacterium]NQZ17970.1 hypothetical protein [Bdellovibrionales bacterium]
MVANNQKGFAIYSFIVATPLFLSLAIMSAWLIWFLNQKHRLDNLCQHYTLKAQENLVKTNNSVLKLNYKAYALIIEKRALELTMLTAPPPVAAAAKLRRKMVIGQQYALKKVQKGLVNTGNLRAQLLSFELRREYIKILRELERHWGASSSFPKIEIYWNKSKIKRKFYEIAPPYKRIAKHSSAQEIRVNWAIPLSSISPGWLKKFITIGKTWKGQCSSHPQKRRFKWEAQIGRVKLLSKSLF